LDFDVVGDQNVKFETLFMKHEETQEIDSQTPQFMIPHDESCCVLYCRGPQSQSSSSLAWVVRLVPTSFELF
jgi:hypothetical protein